MVWKYEQIIIIIHIYIVVLVDVHLAVAKFSKQVLALVHNKHTA